MTTEQIEQSKIIAEFMNAKIDTGYKDQITYRFPLEAAPKEYASYVWSLDGMQYISSWDWQVPVYKKIREELRTIRGNTDDYHSRNMKLLEMEAGVVLCTLVFVSFGTALSNDDKEAGFNALVKAITWYNENKPKP